MKRPNEAQFVLRRLSEQTGGRVFFPSDAKELRRGIQRDQSGAGEPVFLAYESNNPRRNGQFRRISVRVSRASAVARARPGYYAPTSMNRSYPAKYPLRAFTTVDGRLTRTSSRRHSRPFAASMASTYCWRSPSIRLDAATTVSTNVRREHELSARPLRQVAQVCRVRGRRAFGGLQHDPLVQ